MTQLAWPSSLCPNAARSAAWSGSLLFTDNFLAARFTEERHDNFDIYLPLWLAKHNKLIFGVLFCLGIVFAYFRWRAQ